MKFTIIAYILFSLCSNSYAKLIFDDEKLRNSFNENNISEIYEITSTFKKIRKIPSTTELELYKNIYLAAIYRYENAHDYNKIYRTI